VQAETVWAAGLVRVLRAGVHLELGDQLAAQTVACQHPLHGSLYDPLRMVGQLVAQTDLGQAVRVAGIPVVELLVQLATGNVHFVGIDDDHKIAAVLTRRVERLVLPLRTVAICVARRPRFCPAASTTYHSRLASISSAVAL